MFARGPGYNSHYVKSVRIRSYSPYSVRMGENVGQNYSEYEHFSRSVETGCFLMQRKETTDCVEYTEIRDFESVPE